MIEALCRLYIALVVVIGGIIAAPVPCEHKFSVRLESLSFRDVKPEGYPIKYVADGMVHDSCLIDPKKHEHFCIWCGRSQREFCQHDFDWVTDGISSGDTYTVTGGHQHCKKCGFETPPVNYYFVPNLYNQNIYK